MISSTGEYALRAAVFLAQHEGTPQTVAVIAEHTKVPQGYLAKVLQEMVRDALVTSQRGIHGGFVLARPAVDVSILDVLRSVDCAPSRIAKCPLGLPGHVSLCPLHKLMDDAVAAAVRAFACSDLKSLAQSAEGIQALCGDKP